MKCTSRLKGNLRALLSNSESQTYLIYVALAIILGDMGVSLAVTTNAHRLSRVSPVGVSVEPTHDSAG